MLKLYTSPTSPFARKVLVLADEIGLRSQVELISVQLTPMQADAVLSRDNPLSKIPALVIPGQPSLYDSPVICEYLDSVYGGNKMIPLDPQKRFRVLRQQALADGILDAGISVVYEERFRPKDLHWKPWLDGQRRKAEQGLDALEQEASSFDGPIDLAQIAVATLLGWFEFRNPLPHLRESRPNLFAFYDAFRMRPSMQATVPK